MMAPEKVKVWVPIEAEDEAAVLSRSSSQKHKHRDKEDGLQSVVTTYLKTFKKSLCLQKTLKTF